MSKYLEIMGKRKAILRKAIANNDEQLRKEADALLEQAMALQPPTTEEVYGLMAY